MTNEEIAMRKRPQLQPRHLLDPIRPEPEAESAVTALVKPTKKKYSQASGLTRRWDNRIGLFVDDEEQANKLLK